MRLIDNALMAGLQEEAAASPRRRAIVRFHEHEEPVQRMLNALRDDSYVQPHRHADPDKVELFVALTGRLLVLEFDDDGRVTSHAVIGPDEPVRGAEIRPRTWHALLALDPVSVALEIIEGPFEASTHKKFAPWAPEDATEGLAWIRKIRDELLVGA
jgi:cupin fold WbuC family metalloprotein